MEQKKDVKPEKTMRKGKKRAEGQGVPEAFEETPPQKPFKEAESE